MTKDFPQSDIFVGYFGRADKSWVQDFPVQVIGKRRIIRMHDLVIALIFMAMVFGPCVLALQNPLDDEVGR